MKRLSDHWNRFVREEDGAMTAEQSIMLAVLVVVSIFVALMGIPLGGMLDPIIDVSRAFAG